MTARVIGLAWSSALTFVVCASDPGAGVESEPDNDTRTRVALVMKSLANEFFVTMADGARAHQAERADSSEAYELIVNGIKDESDLSQQVALIEQMLAAGVDAIVLAPADSKALAPVVKRVVDRGVVLVNIDNKLDQPTLDELGVQIVFVGPNNRSGARAVGEELARHLSPGDEVAIIGGIPTAFNAQQRQAGFEDAMKQAGMIVVDVQSGGWEQAKANTIAAAMLREHQTLKALICANDNMALGAAAAVRQAGRGGEVLLVGFDNIDAVRNLVDSGEILATADQHADQLAVYGIDVALELTAGVGAVEDRETPVDLVTKEILSRGRR